jgi:glycosyltransferase involved in cell wall biosynthesis
LGVLNRWGLENRRRFLKRCSLQLIELPILRGAAAIHYTAESEQREAATAHPAIGSLPSVIIPIPVGPGAERDPAAFYERFPTAVGRPVILFLSRLDRKKGLELLLLAFCEIRQRFPDALLVIAGSGEDAYVKTLQNNARALGCADAILWPGYVEGVEKAALLAGATVFVLPSFSENFGIAAAEALAAGVPSVLSEHVGFAEEAATKAAALIVPCEVSAITAAVARVLKDNDLREHLAKQGRAFVAARFSLAAVGAKLIELYRTIVGERKVPCAT